MEGSPSLRAVQASCSTTEHHCRRSTASHHIPQARPCRRHCRCMWLPRTSAMLQRWLRLPSRWTAPAPSTWSSPMQVGTGGWSVSRQQSAEKQSGCGASLLAGYGRRGGRACACAQLCPGAWCRRPGMRPRAGRRSACCDCCEPARCVGQRMVSCGSPGNCTAEHASTGAQPSLQPRDAGSRGLHAQWLVRLLPAASVRCRHAQHGLAGA